MEKYVVSREWAEKLKAANFSQRTQFYWHTNHMSGKVTLKQSTDTHEWTVHDTAAPLSDEIMEQLPKGVNVVKEQLTDQYNSGLPRLHRTVANKPADTLAQLWIWAKENGHINTTGGEA